MMHPLPRQPDDDPVTEALRVLNAALARAEALLREAESRPAPAPVDEAIARLGERIERLAAAHEALALRLDELADRIAALEPSERAPALRPERPPELTTIEVTVTGVPGFQGLMETQRTLGALHGVRAAAVRRFHGDEAVLDLTGEGLPDSDALAAALQRTFARPVTVIERTEEAARLRIAPVEADL